MKALLLVAVGLQPSEFDQMTMTEVEAVYEMAKQAKLIR